MSLSYILFTTTDGGVRIVVLLHAYKQGFTALALAAIFSGYELAGMIVNLLAGMAGRSTCISSVPGVFAARISAVIKSYLEKFVILIPANKLTSCGCSLHHGHMK